MKKEYLADDLKKENAELFECVESAYKLILPNITDHVKLSLEKERVGTIAVHASFVRIVDDTTKEIKFTEVHTYFTKLLFGIKPTLNKIIFHESLDAYDAARNQVRIKAEEKFGDLGSTQYGGKYIGKIL